ncbi:MAG TPA: P-loop NTPase, partial [Oscillospiraceae bacterium]|nr:P-loop NTPase [Oscillospiraceae bacterium]
LVENMSYFKCPDCGSEHHIFGESHIGEIAKRHGIRTVCRLPIDPALAAASDRGTIEDVEEGGLDEMVELLIRKGG